MYIIAGFLIFLSCVLVIETGFYAVATVRNPDRRRIRRRLKALPNGAYEASPDILRKRTLSEVPWLNRILLRIPSLQSLDRLLQQADIKYPLGFVILLTLLLPATGYFITSLVTRSQVVVWTVVILLGACPLFYVYWKKMRRMQKLQRQLPDALDLIARALRAGHAFSSGLKLAAEEFDDPLGPEFENVVYEINFGVSVADALKNLAGRVECPDIKYFVISVIIQRETGGNLAEIMESIAHIIRERFRFQGRVEILAAEGKFSALVLILVPILVFVGIYLTSPQYLKALLEDPSGKYVAGISIVMMILGVLFMRKMVEIKV